MAGLNLVQCIGYLGRDPELRYTQSQTAVAQLNIAMTRKYRNAKDELVEETEWARVVVWGKMAETASKFLQKGSMVYVMGRMQTRAWDDKDGTKRYTTEVVAESLQFLDRKGGGGPPHPADRGDDEASQSRTHRGADGGRKRRDDGPPDLGPPPDDNSYIPTGGSGNDDIPF